MTTIQKVAMFTRWMLTIALLYVVYTETGFFTALSFLFMFIAIECQTWLLKQKG